MANGVYNIEQEDGKTFIVFKSTTQRGNISLVLEKTEKFESLKSTDLELELKTTKSDDLFLNNPIIFKKR